jgi:hypothetical protein
VSDTSAPRAVRDADIVYSRVMHELMGRVAKGLELLDLVWSEELLAEMRRSDPLGMSITFSRRSRVDFCVSSEIARKR